ncbi:MAG: RNA polymerase sigma factor [Gemmataceae bacterium]|nr:RNA polymerase sigma factor [Gemmataceae bacterium]
MTPTPDARPADGILDLYDQHATRVLAFLRAHAPPGVDAEDVAQDLWARLHRKLGDSGTLQGNPRAFLFRAAKNLLADGRKKKRAGPLLDGFDASDTSPKALDMLIRLELSRQLEGCIGLLPPDQAEMIRRKVAGESPALIAEAMRRDPAQVHKKLFNAKHALEECLGRKEEGA